MIRACGTLPFKPANRTRKGKPEATGVQLYGGVGTGVLSPTGRVGHGGLTQTNRSPEFPGRFRCLVFRHITFSLRRSRRCDCRKAGIVTQYGRRAAVICI